MKLIIIFLIGIIILSGCSRPADVAKYSDYPPIIEDSNSDFENKVNCFNALKDWVNKHDLRLESTDGVNIVCNGEECICQ